MKRKKYKSLYKDPKAAANYWEQQGKDKFSSRDPLYKGSLCDMRGSGSFTGQKGDCVQVQEAQERKEKSRPQAGFDIT